jgi:membrane protease YdiL (CAAX protease family)
MMAAMPNLPGRYWTAVGAGWLVMAAAAAIYAGMKGIAAPVAIPVAAAFLAEFPFYLLPAFAPEKLASPWLLAASALVPYLAYAAPTGELRVGNLLLLSGIAGVLAFWYRVLKRSAPADLLFLTLAAAVMLSRVFDQIYLSPIPKVPLSILGHLMLIRTAAIAVLAIRGDAGARYAFWPSGRDFATGVKWFAGLAPVAAAALWLVGLWQTRPGPRVLLLVPYFFGFLWVVALSEDFFFWGLLSQRMEKLTKSGTAALLVTSVLFGSVHLWFHRAFPNWRFAIVAAVFGLFCGLSWRESRSVQAAMVTHALGATFYQVFFQ